MVAVIEGFHCNPIPATASNFLLLVLLFDWLLWACFLHGIHLMILNPVLTAVATTRKLAETMFACDQRLYFWTCTVIANIHNMSIRNNGGAHPFYEVRVMHQIISRFLVVAANAYGFGNIHDETSTVSVIAQEYL